MPDIKYQRPEAGYITTTSTIKANRFQEEAQDQNPLKASDLDQEFNALIDNDNDLSARIAEVVAGAFPGADKTENLDKIVYSDGTGAKWKKLARENISDNAITSEKISNNAVIRGKVAIGAIGTNNLIDRNVTNAKLGNESVNTRTLADSSVTTPKIQDGSVTASKLSANSVTTEKILDNSVTTSKFADGSFTTNKLADKSLTPRKTQGCFILGELKFSVLDSDGNSFYPFVEGWIPITSGAGGRIVADCFPELRDVVLNGRGGMATQRYISIKPYQAQTETFAFLDGVPVFDFSALVGAYPMLMGSTFPVSDRYTLGALGWLGWEYLIEKALILGIADLKEELKTGNFTYWNIPQQTIRDYANSTIASANQLLS